MAALTSPTSFGTIRFERVVSLDDRWLEAALAREEVRDLNFSEIEKCLEGNSWFDPADREGIIAWFRQICLKYELGPVIFENAIFFLDAFTSVVADSGETMSSLNYKMSALMTILLASKQFGVKDHLHVDTIAPEFSGIAEYLAEYEMEVFSRLNFNLFVPTTAEYTLALIKRLNRACAHLFESDVMEAEFEEMLKFGAHYNELFLENVFNLAHKQSMKALSASTVAVARWCVGHSTFCSGAEEASALRTCISAFDNPDSTNVHPVVAHVQAEWCKVVTDIKWFESPDPAVQGELLDCVEREVWGGGRYPSEARPLPSLRATEVQVIYETASSDKQEETTCVTPTGESGVEDLLLSPVAIKGEAPLGFLRPRGNSPTDVSIFAELYEEESQKEDTEKKVAGKRFSSSLPDLRMLPEAVNHDFEFDQEQENPGPDSNIQRWGLAGQKKRRIYRVL